jgi:hypothetical protein
LNHDFWRRDIDIEVTNLSYFAKMRKGSLIFAAGFLGLNGGLGEGAEGQRNWDFRVFSPEIGIGGEVGG